MATTMTELADNRACEVINLQSIKMADAIMKQWNQNKDVTIQHVGQ